MSAWLMPSDIARCDDERRERARGDAGGATQSAPHSDPRAVVCVEYGIWNITKNPSASLQKLSNVLCVMF